MKVVVPTKDDGGLGAMVATHFGSAPYFTVVDTETDTVRAEANSGQHFGGKGTPAEAVARTGAEVVLCSGMGRKALALFGERGIQVFVNAHGAVGDALSAYRAGTLPAGREEDACQHGHESGGGHEG